MPEGDGAAGHGQRHRVPLDPLPVLRARPPLLLEGVRHDKTRPAFERPVVVECKYDLEVIADGGGGDGVGEGVAALEVGVGGESFIAPPSHGAEELAQLAAAPTCTPPHAQSAAGK